MTSANQLKVFRLIECILFVCFRLLLFWPPCGTRDVPQVGAVLKLLSRLQNGPGPLLASKGRIPLLFHTYSVLFSQSILGPVLIVCPGTVLKQWLAEFRSWIPTARVVIIHSSGSGYGNVVRLAFYYACFFNNIFVFLLIFLVSTCGL